MRILNSKMALSCRFRWVHSEHIWSIIHQQQPPLFALNWKIIAADELQTTSRSLNFIKSCSCSPLCALAICSVSWKYTKRLHTAPAKRAMLHDVLWSIFRCTTECVVRRWNHVNSTRKREIPNTKELYWSAPVEALAPRRWMNSRELFSGISRVRCFFAPSPFQFLFNDVV